MPARKKSKAKKPSPSSRPGGVTIEQLRKFMRGTRGKQKPIGALSDKELEMISKALKKPYPKKKKK